MLVSELIERLEGFNPDAEIKIGLQPNYPLEANIYGVWDGEDTEYEAVYILAGDSKKYLTGDAWEEAERC